MAHIELHNDLPGIRGLMAFRPETALPLNQLAEVLLRSNNNSLNRGERELIGAYTSYLNQCRFCQNVHGALAAYYLDCGMDYVELIKKSPDTSDISDKMKSLLAIAASVQKGGKSVTEDQIARARNQGASDKEIHDTVLIAAAFCMFNRYVDGLGTWAPDDILFYTGRAPRRAKEGYVDTDVNR